MDELKCRMLDDGTYGEFMPVSWSPTRFMDSGATLFFFAEEKDAVALAASTYPAESSGACGEDRVSADQLRKTQDIPVLTIPRLMSGSASRFMMKALNDGLRSCHGRSSFIAR